MLNPEIKIMTELDEAGFEVVRELEKAVFDDPLSTDVLRSELKAHTKIITLIAYLDSKPCGYKIGYAQSPKRFYSWIGGVHPSYRNQGLAKKLMAKQHELAVKDGYKFVVTSTQNKYGNMLILNLKSGFQITGTKANLDSKELSILMEKALK